MRRLIDRPYVGECSTQHRHAATALVTKPGPDAFPNFNAEGRWIAWRLVDHVRQQRSELQRSRA